MTFRFNLLLILTLLTLNSCTSVKVLHCGDEDPNSDQVTTIDVQTDSITTDTADVDTDATITIIDDFDVLPPLAFVDKTDPEEANTEDPKIEGINIFVNSQTQKWINYYSTKAKKRFQRFLNRGNKYKSVVQAILKENDLPPELYYLAMIESGYSIRAYSRAKAVGLWQFMRGTGRKYGLEVNYYVDERRDPIRATESAAKYLRDLYLAFQSWELALAAYNAGEYGILTSIIRGKTRSYWELIKAKKIPRETRSYIPKFMAAVTIGQNPEKYGFTVKETEAYPDISAVEVPSPISLKNIAKFSKVSLKLLKKINPHIKRRITPPHHATYEIWVPEEKSKLFKNAKKKLSRYKIKKIKKHYVGVDNRYYHRVKKGQSLYLIAKMYKISIAHLKRLNGLKSNKIFPNKKLRISTRSYRPEKKKLNNTKSGYYKVKKGDTLSAIAIKLKMSLKKLKRINRLHSSRIYPGMRLKCAKKNCSERS
ncbi:MAG: LysM peptidoglycan-binding domain-containing protein [Bacteriovoracaceae bacterium]|nr:LysM peptidoglycan-binding domain-containing protein [Bacteriovoracaceae bacterium]